MTRATLLQLLAHPTALNGADVRALEQLADAFPYCQTAHLLLAKAAHDQGSMLAGQRLRRAATYAADRTHLRQLIELPVPAAAPTALVAAATRVEVPLPQSAAVFNNDEEAPTPLATTESVEEQAVTIPTYQAVLEDKPDQVIAQAGATASLPAANLAATPEQPEPVAVPVAEAPTAAEPPENTYSAQAEMPTEKVLEVAEEEVPVETVAETSQEKAPVDTVAEAAEEDELPVQAPPIRPPAEAATARFEFGLAEQEPAEITAYRLPELAELVAPASEAVAPATPKLPVFRGLTEVSYAPEEGSRLGFCLVATAQAELLPSSSLPPAGEFFAPDALLLAHLATHQLLSEPKPSTISLIDSFLQRAPSATRRRPLPSLTAAEPEAQADLSVRSTRAEPDLASESLAKILVRQGKTDRAIAVYERLMVKHPEKMAYFAAQIESLRPSA